MLNAEAIALLDNDADFDPTVWGALAATIYVAVSPPLPPLATSSDWVKALRSAGREPYFRTPA